MDDEIREVLDNQARLSKPAAEISDSADLYALGLTSHASVNLMLALEDAFDVEFPERMLRKGTFGSIESIRSAVAEIQGAGV